LLTKLWVFGTGPVTALLIATKLTPETQGYYYTFGTIIALQVFVELGLGTAVRQFASHEWSKLRLDEDGHIRGDQDSLSRLISLSAIAMKWYIIAGLVVVFGLSTTGYIFFSRSPDFQVNWVLPWISLCFLTGLNICLTPIWSLLEGCNQVSRLYTYRFIQGVVVSLSTWLAILLGLKLWVVSVSSIAGLICAAIFLKRKYVFFFKTLLFTSPTGSLINWRDDILPMQWRLVLSWISGYLAFSLFTPVLFKYYGPVVAGQMGMTWSLLGILGIASSWVYPKVPQFAILIAQKKYAELDAFFWKITRIAIAIIILTGIGIYLLVCLLNLFPISLAKRILPPLPTGLFLLAQMLITASIPFAEYLRAHKKEPLMFVSTLNGVLIGFSTLILGKYYSATGMAAGYMMINFALVPSVFLIWARCRTVWHNTGDI
jgi:hypothetical protein